MPKAVKCPFCQTTFHPHKSSSRRVCEYCGEDLPPAVDGKNLLRKYCSDGCRLKAWRESKREEA